MKVYLDVYFMMNFIMNIVLIMLTGMIRNKSLRLLRWIIIGITCAILSTILYVLSFSYGKMMYFIDFLVLFVLLYGSFSFEKSEWKMDLCVFLALMSISAGCITLAYNFWNLIIPGIHETVSIKQVIAGLLLLGISLVFFSKEILCKSYRQKNTVQIKAVVGKKQSTLRVLLDSGNQLRSPYSGERVGVISQTIADQILDLSGPPIYIPYQTIASCGVLPSYRIDFLVKDNKVVAKNMLVMVSKELNQNRDYQMIIHQEQITL